MSQANSFHYWYSFQWWQVEFLRRSGSRASLSCVVRLCMPRARLVSHPTLGPLGQPEKAMGHESQIEPWLAPDNRALLVGLRTELASSQKAMKTAGEENQKRYAVACSVPRLRNGTQEQSCSIGRAGGQEKLLPREKCFSLTPFIELLGSWRLPTPSVVQVYKFGF